GWRLGVGRWAWVVGRWSLDVGRRPFDVGRWRLDVGRWTLDVGRWTFSAIILLSLLLMARGADDLGNVTFQIPLSRGSHNFTLHQPGAIPAPTVSLGIVNGTYDDQGNFTP